MNTSVADLNSSLLGLGAGIVFFLFVLIFAFFVTFILAYIFKSLAFYKFMKARNLDNAFLAWIPIVGAYAVGKVYDDINEKQGKKTNFSIILLIVNCAYWALSMGLLGSNNLGFLLLALGVAMLVLELVCYNTIFKTYAPNNSSYFVLTIIFTLIPIVPFIPGLCLLKASKNQPVSEINN